MRNHLRNAHQKHWASSELSRLTKQARRRNAIPATKQAQRELAASAVADHPVTKIAAGPRRDRDLDFVEKQQA